MIMNRSQPLTRRGIQSLLSLGQQLGQRLGHITELGCRSSMPQPLKSCRNDLEGRNSRLTYVLSPCPFSGPSNPSVMRALHRLHKARIQYLQSLGVAMTGHRVVLLQALLHEFPRELELKYHWLKGRESGTVVAGKAADKLAAFLKLLQTRIECYEVINRKANDQCQPGPSSRSSLAASATPLHRGSGGVSDSRVDFPPCVLCKSSHRSVEDCSVTPSPDKV